jgi:hypothetical protein
MLEWNGRPLLIDNDPTSPLPQATRAINNWWESAPSLRSFGTHDVHDRSGSNTLAEGTIRMAYASNRKLSEEKRLRDV